MSPSSYDDFPSLPSMPTVRAGDARDALGRIDHYDLLRKLGGGGFGVVYLARDTASGVEVAIKTLHPLLKANAEEMDALREKFRLVHGLTHPNIAKALVLHPVRDVNVWDEAARQELRLSPGPASGVYRVLRGGGCWDDPRNCRSSNRARNWPSSCIRYLGLRLLALQDDQ